MSMSARRPLKKVIDAIHPEQSFNFEPGSSPALRDYLSEILDTETVRIDHVTKLIKGEDSGEKIGLKLLMSELLHSETFEQDGLVAELSAIVAAGLSIRNEHLEKFGKMPLSDGFTDALAENLEINGQKLRRIFSSMRANAVLLMEENTSLQDSFHVLVQNYVNAYLSRPISRQFKTFDYNQVFEWKKEDTPKNWYGLLKKSGVRAISFFLLYELDFMDEVITHIHKEGLSVCPLTIQIFELLLKGNSFAETGRKISEKTGVAFNEKSVAAWLLLCTLDFPGELKGKSLITKS